VQPNEPRRSSDFNKLGFGDTTFRGAVRNIRPSPFGAAADAHHTIRPIMACHG
jgi:hypothetical protein